MSTFPQDIDKDKIGFCIDCRYYGIEKIANRLIKYDNGETRLCITHYLLRILCNFYIDKFNYDGKTSTDSALDDLKNLKYEILMENNIQNKS